MDMISYFETYINSKTFLNKKDVNADIKKISEKHFRRMVKIKFHNLPFGGWEIRAKGLRNLWVKAYIIDEGYTFKIYWYNSNEFLRWVATIIVYELALLYNSNVFSGKNLKIIISDNTWYKTFKDYASTLDNIYLHHLPKKIKKVFEII